MSKVFVVQMPHHWDDEKQTYVPKWDISTAEVFGELVYLLTPTAAPFNPIPIVAELHRKLENYSDKDWILMIGNPALISFTGAIASHYNNGRINVLQWSGREGGYTPVKVVGLL